MAGFSDPTIRPLPSFSAFSNRELGCEVPRDHLLYGGPDPTMSARLEGFLLIALVIALSLVFQVQMKLFGGAAANAVSQAKGGIDTVTALLEVAVTWRGFAIALLACAQFVLWLMALSRLDLSLAIPLLSLGLLLVAWSGGVWLGEQLNLLRGLGLGATAVGICLVIFS